VFRTVYESARRWTDDHDRFVKCTAFRYCTDFITPEEALEMLKKRESGKQRREAEVLKDGYPAYTTSESFLPLSLHR
jgi:L-fuconate dehydratase